MNTSTATRAEPQDGDLYEKCPHGTQNPVRDPTGKLSSFGAGCVTCRRLYQKHLREEAGGVLRQQANDFWKMFGGSE